MVQLSPNRSPKLRSLSAHRRRRSLRPWCLRRGVSRLLQCSQSSSSHLPKQGRQVLQLQGWLTLRSCRKRCLPMPSWWKRLTRPSKSLWMKSQPTRTVKKWKQRWRIKWRLARSFRPFSSCQSCLQKISLQKKRKGGSWVHAPSRCSYFCGMASPIFMMVIHPFPKFEMLRSLTCPSTHQAAANAFLASSKPKKAKAKAGPKAKKWAWLRWDFWHLGTQAQKLVYLGYQHLGSLGHSCIGVLLSCCVKLALLWDLHLGSVSHVILTGSGISEKGLHQKPDWHFFWIKIMMPSKSFIICLSNTLIMWPYVPSTTSRFHTGARSTILQEAWRGS